MKIDFGEILWYTSVAGHTESKSEHQSWSGGKDNGAMYEQEPCL